ncbi:MAG: nitrogen fixation protein NifZ, partial [Hyphomicrobium sp.]
FYIYAVEWIDRGTIVGMRAKELVSIEREALQAAKPQAVVQQERT